MPSSPSRGSHAYNPSLSEAVLMPQSMVDTPTTAMLNGRPYAPATDENLAEHHEALIGDEFRNPINVNKQPTLATLGDTPFAHETGDEIEHHHIVATEVVKDLRFECSPEPILQNAFILLDP